VTADPHGLLVPPGKLVVLGDNAAWSHDSRQIGYIPGERLLGTVVSRIRPKQAQDLAEPGDPEHIPRVPPFQPSPGRRADEPRHSLAQVRSPGTPAS
jgi:hypothetical protein